MCIRDRDIIWKESPWVPLVVEKLVSAHSKNLTGFYILSLIHI